MPLPWNFILNNLIILEKKKESKQNYHELSWVFDNTNVKALQEKRAFHNQLKYDSLS